MAAGRSLAAEDRLLHRVRLLLLAGGASRCSRAWSPGGGSPGAPSRPVERAYEAQAGFAADASHELRTPLTFVRSGRRGARGAASPDLGGEVLAEVDYLTGLTQRLLLLARAERGSVQLDVEPVDVGAACRSAAHRSERAHGNALSTGGERPGRARRSRGARGGARRGPRERRPPRRRGGRRALAPRGRPRVVIEVADHGRGIPEDLRGRAFERFFRADPSRARETGGAGLGLALAERSWKHSAGGCRSSRRREAGLTVLIGLRAA